MAGFGDTSQNPVCGFVQTRGVLIWFIYLQSHKKKVFVFSSRNDISQEMRTGADGYIDVLKIETDNWSRALRHREQMKK